MTTLTYIRDLRRNALANQLKYERPKQIVEQWFKARDIPIQTEIWIQPNYPYSWDAILGAWDRVWIMNYSLVYNEMVVKDIQHVQGFLPNGMLIIS